MISIQQWTRGSETLPAIDGRELHKALEIGRDFPTWITTRIHSYSYIEGEDFAVSLVARGGGTPAKEYTLTLAAAAELCLLERSDIGRELRRFILDQQSLQNAPKCSNSGEICTDHKPMWELTIDELQQNTALKACPRCHTAHKNEGELCQACNRFNEVQAQKAVLVRERNGSVDPGSNDLIQCLIERSGDTTMTVPGSYGTIVTFRRNEWGHAVARVENPQHRANILKSIFYRSYVAPDQEAA